MIRYESGGFGHFIGIFQLNGSVFPKAIAVAIPCGLMSVLFVTLVTQGEMEFLGDPDESVLRDNAAWSGFSFLVGFLIVFRTSQSYNRFWDGCTSTHMMRAEWFDGCSSLMAFCRYSTADDELISEFQNILVRLFSMLHSAALAEIEDTSSPDVEDVESFKFELLDVEGIDDASLMAVRDSQAKVELIFQWIQTLVVDNIKTGVLSIPPPILSRSFQEIANGMVAFHDAMKISQIPFPFPYAQTCDFLLMLHWMVIPFLVSQWCKEAVWAFVFSFIQVFILWVLNMIAVELENPFGHDANDIDGREMQHEMNALLLLLMSPIAMNVPILSDRSTDLRRQGAPNFHVRGKSFVDVWSDLMVENTCQPAHISHRVSVNMDADKRASRVSWYRNNFPEGDNLEEIGRGRRYSQSSNDPAGGPEDSRATWGSGEVEHLGMIDDEHGASFSPALISEADTEGDLRGSDAAENPAGPSTATESHGPVREWSELPPSEPHTTPLPSITIESTTLDTSPMNNGPIPDGRHRDKAGAPGRPPGENSPRTLGPRENSPNHPKVFIRDRGRDQSGDERFNANAGTINNSLEGTEASKRL